MSGKWAAWARQLDGLLRTIPNASAPAYLNDAGERECTDLELPCGIRRGLISDQLRRARADADAMAAAYEHLAEEISRRTDAILNPPPAEHEHRFPWPLGPSAGYAVGAP